MISTGIIPSSVANLRQGMTCIRHIHARQATSIHSVYMHRAIGLIFSLCKPHFGGNPQKKASKGKWVDCHMPLRPAHRPILPAPTLNWALTASTRSFIDLPLRVFLGTLSAAKGQLGYCTINVIISHFMQNYNIFSTIIYCVQV